MEKKISFTLGDLFALPQFCRRANPGTDSHPERNDDADACGEFFAILIAGIDLSVGSVLALPVLSPQNDGGGHARPGRAVGQASASARCWARSTALINFTKLHPFIITLGTQSIFRGVTMIISGCSPSLVFQSF